MSKLDDAEAGQIWICPACGERARNVNDFALVACVVRAVLCDETQADFAPLRAVLPCSALPARA